MRLKYVTMNLKKLAMWQWKDRHFNLYFFKFLYMIERTLLLFIENKVLFFDSTKEVVCIRPLLRLL